MWSINVKSGLVPFAIVLCLLIQTSNQVSVSPQVDFVEDNNSEKMPPKIQGVRVIVDAQKFKGTEDKTETIRIQTMDGAKQTVGIHTDITFEIDDKKNDSKPTDGKNAESSETEDEVPIYKGTHTDNDRNDYNRRYDPHEHHMNHPSFHGVNDEEGIRYADAGTWIRFLPSSNGGWTTERYSESFKPQNRRYPPSGFVPYGIGQKSYRPCICDGDKSFWRDNNRRSFGPSTHRTFGTDDKLEYPFSETD